MSISSVNGSGQTNLIDFGNFRFVLRADIDELREEMHNLKRGQKNLWDEFKKAS